MGPEQGLHEGTVTSDCDWEYLYFFFCENQFESRLCGESSSL